MLDEGGKHFTTAQFSEFLERSQHSSASSLTFALGGPNGWSSEVRKRAQQIVSLSPLTFPYQLARLILIEQLYRCYTIDARIPYHR
jgi:23S rRNA (pseudouridine1915-N3)-methyltransferase